MKDIKDNSLEFKPREKTKKFKPKVLKNMAITFAVTFEYADEDLLNERGSNTTPTSVDALLAWRDMVIPVESKFTETAFGHCSQVNSGNCSGSFSPGSDKKT